MRKASKPCFLNPHHMSGEKPQSSMLVLERFGLESSCRQVYDEAQKISPEDWEIWHNKGGVPSRQGKLSQPYL